MKNNEILEKEIEEAIKWNHLLHSSAITVTAKGGVIILRGSVDSFAGKYEAHSIAKKASDVKLVIDYIEVKFDERFSDKTDLEIAEDVMNEFKWDLEVPDDMIKVIVNDGWVILEGELNWNYQRVAAKRAAGNQAGVKGIINNIRIRSDVHNEIEKVAIESALKRHWSIMDLDIEVNVSANMVTLKGKVDSFYQKEEAEKIAWNAPGVWKVENELVVGFDD
jgi:osmotically-inducible protein OsmY